MAYKVVFPCAVVKMKDKSRVTLLQGALVPSDVDAEHFRHLLKMKAVKKAEKPADPAPDSVEGILAGVGDDKAKAAEALKAEEAKGDKARKTLVDPLKTILGKA